MNKKDLINSVFDVTGLKVRGKNIRSEIQEGIAEIDCKALWLQICTGLGKTRASLLSVTGNKVLIICSQIAHEKNFQEEVEKWGFTYDITYVNYRSLHKYSKHSFDTVICDEADCFTPTSVSKMKHISYKKLIVMSATFSYKKRILVSQLGNFKKVKINLLQAISWSILPIPEFRIIYCPLSNDQYVFEMGNNKKKKIEVITYKEYTSKYKFIPRKIRNNLRILCTQKEHYAIFEELFAECYNEEGFVKPTMKQRIKILGSQRKRFLTDIKFKKVEYLFSILGRKRTISFLGSKEHANQLSNKTGYKALTSDNSKKVNQKIIDDFNTLKTSRIYSVDILTRGMNLSNLERSIIMRIDGSVEKIHQIIGRSERSKKPIIYMLVVPNTRDYENFIKFKDTMRDSWFKIKKI